MKLILGQALRLTGIGLAIAVPCAVAISRAMAGLIFGVVSLDYAILAGFTALLLLMALGAGYLPRPARPSAFGPHGFHCATNSEHFFALLMLLGLFGDAVVQPREIFRRAPGNR